MAALGVPIPAIPIFNLNRAEICCTMGVTVLMCVVVAGLVVWNPPPGQGWHRGNVVVFFGVLLSLLCVFISAVKLLCGYGSAWGSDDDYEELKEAIPTSVVVDAPESARQMRSAPLATGERKAAEPPTAAAIERAPSWGAERTTETGEMLVDAGLVLERLADGEGPRGAWRVKNVVPKSPCARQGACDPGDVVVSVGGRPLSKVATGQLAGLLRGKIGTTVALELDGGHRRTVILAPDPSTLTELLL